MKIYLDVSCLNRPFDDQRQARIRLEAEAITVLFELIDENEIVSVSSEMAEIEINAMPDGDRRRKVKQLLPPSDDIIKLTPGIYRRASSLEKLGFKPADAVHVAAAERISADFMLTCDDRLCRGARRHNASLRTRIMNVVDFVRECINAPDAG